MTRPRRLTPLALALIAPIIAAACRDATAPLADASNGQLSAPALEVSEEITNAAVIDAADRLALSVQESALRAQLQGHLRGLAAAVNERRSVAALGELDVTRRSLKKLRDGGFVSDADIDAIDLALDDAARRIAALPSP